MTARRFGTAWLLWMLLLVTLDSSGKDLYIDTRESYNLSQYAGIYEDESGTMDFAKVREQMFVFLDQRDHNFGFSHSAYWFRIKIHPSPYSAYKEWWLRIYYPLLDDIKVYGVDTRGDLVLVKESGDLRPFESREVNHSSFLFGVPLYGGPITLYIRVASQGSIQVPMALQSSQSVIEEDQSWMLMTGIYYGIFIIIFLYNSIMYSYTRERNYLSYLIFITAFMIWQLAINGIGVKYLWTDWAWMATVGPPLSTAFAAVAAVHFSRHFLLTKTFMPRVDAFLKVMMIVSMLLAVSVFVLPYGIVMFCIAFLAAIMPLILLGTGIVIWINYFQPARFYVLGWSSFLLGTVMVALNHYGLLTGYMFFNYAQQVGSALEMIFLSWALADRIKLMQDEYVGKLNSLNVTLKHKVAASLQKERDKDRLLLKQSRLAAMGEMIEQIAHQWRQPLNTMALIMQDLYFKLQLKTFKEDDFYTAHEKINNTLQYMSKTIDDFRNFHKSDKDVAVISAEDVVTMAIELNEASLKYAGTACILHSDHPHDVKVCKSELVQILMNLIKNARDAIVERQVEEGRIDISISQGRDGVHIIVEDNGGGIGNDVIEKIFDPYFTTKDSSQGTGLGLYMSRSIIEESMHGTLNVENGNSGARFIITLPTAEEDRDEAVRETAEGV